MKIRNYIVENYQLLMDCLEKELCKNGISYVRIDNEIHYLDQIIRFYDIELDLKEIIWWALSFSVINDKIEKPNMYFNHKPLIVNYNFQEEINFIKLEKDYQPRNKYIQKQESNRVNQKLKKYRK